MIIDRLENANRYLTINNGFKGAFEFLMRKDLKDLPVGKYEIDGDRVFAIVAKDLGRKKEDAELESHEKYIDIQFILEGIDGMGYKPKIMCANPSDDYNPENDIQFFSDEPDCILPVNPGYFAIFFPEDAHMPLISSDQIHKVIVKVAV